MERLFLKGKYLSILKLISLEVLKLRRRSDMLSIWHEEHEV